MNSKTAIVYCEATRDRDPPHKQWAETRKVYRFGDEWYVSHLGRRQGRLAIDNGDGTFTVVYRSWSIVRS